MADRDSKGRFIKDHTSFVSSAETRKKMSESAKRVGTGKWMSGRKLSEETKKKIGENSARYWLGKERKSMVGNQFAEGNKPNKTSFAIGSTPWNKGKRFSTETRKKMSESRKLFYASGGVHPLLGVKRSDMAGKNNPNWGKFGSNHPKWTESKKHPFHKSIRQLFKYVEWRKSVFERDNYVCTMCGVSKSFIEADHHPKRFIDIIKDNNVRKVEDAIECDELWDVRNGRTLCNPCHRTTPTWGRAKGSKKNNKN